MADFARSLRREPTRRELMIFRNGPNIFLAGVLVACLASAPAAAQSKSSSASAATDTASASGYNQPPKYILDVMHAPSPPAPVVSPTHDSILLVSW